MPRSPNTRYLDNSTEAPDPGRVTVSDRKLRQLRPDLYGVTGAVQAALGALHLSVPQKGIITEGLLEGDSRAAVVVSVAPLLIAAYADELDCVALLRFPNDLARQYELSEGSRLLTVNLYGEQPQPECDLVPGPGDSGNWGDFHPIIADFVSDATSRIEERKAQISEEEWQRAYALGCEYLRSHPGTARDGRPGCSAVSANVAHHVEASIRSEKRRAQLVVGCAVLLPLVLLAALAVGVLAAATAGARRSLQASGTGGGPPPSVRVSAPGPMEAPSVPTGEALEQPGGDGETAVPPPVPESPEAAALRRLHEQAVAEARERAEQTQEDARRRIEEVRARHTGTAVVPGAGAVAGDEAYPLRIWTDNTGRNHVRARFVSLAGDRVTLKKADGSVVTLPVSRLSGADTVYLRSLSRRQP